MLPESFYERDALEVAADLVGKLLVRGSIVLRITEVEAYRPGDSASHCRSGRTARNAPMWGPPGRAYVYLCYGIHSMLNLVTNRDGEGAAVLVRSCEPVSGLSALRRRRPHASGTDLLTGPGRVAAALGLDPSWSGHPVFLPGGLEVRDGPPPVSLLEGARIGIDYALPIHREAPWRLADAGSAWVSHRRALRPRA
ncbi:MAG: DNA-3-methyladenine glycosylase [Myxococcota bacterium]|nr:DNA-3-methyladenine glycosylase [Myxococcota bacterium]